MASIYQFKHGARVKGDPQVVGAELERISRRPGGLTPGAVLRSAWPSKSPLHEYFEWDDAKAANAFRLDQAGHLIRSVTVVIEPEPDGNAQIELAAVASARLSPAHVRAFLPVSTTTGDRVYVSTAEALSDAGFRQQVLRQAHDDLGAVARKYRELKELAEVIAAIDRVGTLLQESSSVA